jgi:hypothetical protein
MLYSDWLKSFEQVQICNLSPDSFEGQLTAQQVCIYIKLHIDVTYIILLYEGKTYYLASDTI